MNNSKPYGVVYRIKCLVNGKCYYGQTVNTKVRWNDHFRKDSHCHALRNAIQKYGRSNFKFEIVDSASSKEELDALEKNLVATSMSPRGYNLKEGGSHGKHTQACRKHMSEIQKRVQNLPEVKARNSAGVKKAMARPEVNEKHRASLKARMNRPEVREYMSRVMKEIHARPEQKEKRRAAIKASWAAYSAEERAARTAKQRLAMSTPEYKARMSKASRESLARPEVKEKLRASIRKSITAERRERARQDMKKRHTTPGYSKKMGEAISRAHNTPEGKVKLARRRRRGESEEAHQIRLKLMDAAPFMTKKNPYDPENSNSNMYGFIPCPKCGSRYRCAFVNKPGIVQCDDCGFEEPYAVVPNDVEEDIKE